MNNIVSQKTNERIWWNSIVLYKADINGFFENCKIFPSKSLGEESLIEHPAIMTHGSIDKNLREKLGITDNFDRASVGIEDVEDLIEDLNYALKEARFS